MCPPLVILTFTINIGAKMNRKMLCTEVSFIILTVLVGTCSNSFTGPCIVVSVPCHTGHVSSTTTFEEIILPTNISFGDFYSRVCSKMDLEPQTVSLGFKFNRDLRRDPYRDLTNEHQLRAAMAHGVYLIQRARKRRVVLEIRNMVSHSSLPIYKSLTYHLPAATSSRDCHSICRLGAL